MSLSKTVLAATATSLVIACASHADTATPTTIDGLKGRTLRVVHPGEMITLECRADRVTISVDKDNKITTVNFC